MIQVQSPSNVFAHLLLYRDCTVYRQDVRDLCRRHREKRRARRRVRAAVEYVEVADDPADDFSILDVPAGGSVGNAYPRLEGIAAGEARARSAREGQRGKQ